MTGNTKVARNTMCPCGSGKKYKKCCLLSEQSDINRGMQDRLSSAYTVQRFRSPLSRAVPAPISRRRLPTWNRVICTILLRDGRLIEATAIFSEELLNATRIETGGVVRLSFPEIKFRGEAIIQSIHPANDQPDRDGQLVVAMKKKDFEDFGVMIFGVGRHADRVMDRRAKLSRLIEMEMLHPDGSRSDITLNRFLDWIKTNNVRVGADIFLDLPHVGVRGFARVLAI